MSDGLVARAAAQSVLSEVLRKCRPLDVALDGLTQMDARDAGFARALASETLRRLGQIEALIHHCVPKTPQPHKAGPTLEILYAGTCELIFLNVAPHAAVDAANRLAQADAKAVHFKPLINAVLRRLSREGKALVATQDAARLNIPDWLWQRWCETYGEETTRAISEAQMRLPPLDIMLKDDALAAPDGATLFDSVRRLSDSGRVDTLPGFAEGNWWVQDAAATLPAHLLGDVRGRKVIDLCAAPGGKTMQLAAAGADVIAVERDAQRLTRIAKNLERTKLKAELVEADIRDFMPETPAPFVLLDAPCSATGTIRRHPELPWIKSSSDVTLCEQAAGELIDAAAQMVAPGGLLVFAVCSLEPEEGFEQVERFLARDGRFVRVPVTANDVYQHGEWVSGKGDLRTLPCHLPSEGGMDGFYAARLKRVS